MAIYFLMLLGLLAWGGTIAWSWKQTKDFAPEVLAAKKDAGELPDSVSHEEFTDLYLRSEGPRGGTYFFVCAAFLLILLAPFIAGFNQVWKILWVISGQSPVFEIGTLIHTFSLFLAFMALSIGTLALAMRRFYALTPPTMRQIVQDLNGEG